MMTLAGAWLSLVAVVFPQEIEKESLKPGAKLSVALPQLGNSWRSQGADPVTMQVILPDNYKPDQKHPVLIFLPGGTGNPDHIDRWHRVLEGKNFIFVGLDFAAKPGAHPFASGFPNAVEALKVLQKATAIDPRNVIISGESSGAYSLTGGLNGEFGGKLHTAFSAFVPVIGGMEINPARLGRRPVLHIAGENDTAKASAGRARVEVQRASHEKLAKARRDSTLIIQEGVGHAWKKDKDAEIRAWIYAKLPIFAELTAIEMKLKKTKSASTRARYRKKLAESWLDHPAVRKAKEAGQ